MNNNCLEGMICPQCKSWEPFKIVGIAVFEVEDAGTGDYKDMEWTGASLCSCIKCGFTGSVADFEKAFDAWEELHGNGVDEVPRTQQPT